MLDTTKENIKDYSTIALIITLLTGWIRPFTSVWNTIKEMSITFIFSMCGGLMLVGVDLAQPVRFGLAGIMGLSAVRLYNILDITLKDIEKDPIKFAKEVKNQAKKK